VLYAIAYREDFVKPTFVVDVSDEFERKLEAVRCYGSQFDGASRPARSTPTASRCTTSCATRPRTTAR
jgi:LmbE family N-acetylglucosaminyl deacetylase